jgi:hypothetical protein
LAGYAEAASNNTAGTAAQARIREKRRLTAMSGNAVTMVAGSERSAVVA